MRTLAVVLTLLSLPPAAFARGGQGRALLARALRVVRHSEGARAARDVRSLVRS